LSISELGSLGEFIASLAVLATLFILAFQVRGARVELSRQMTREIKRHNNDAFHQLTQNPSLSDLHLRGRRDYFALTEAEQLTWIAWLFTWINQTEDGWIARQRGIPGMNWVDTYVLGVALVLRSEGGRVAWSFLRTFFEEEFVRALEQTIQADEVTFLEAMPSLRGSACGLPLAGCLDPGCRLAAYLLGKRRVWSALLLAAERRSVRPHEAALDVVSRRQLDELARRLLRSGVVLILLSLVIGLVIPGLTVPRLGVAAHVNGVVGGLALIVLGLLWPHLDLSPRARRAVFWLGVYSFFVATIMPLLGAVWGAGASMLPIAAGAARGTPVQEAILSAGLITAGASVFVLFVLLFVGLRGAARP
jgi:hydroxylaminobenzene mutase